MAAAVAIASVAPGCTFFEPETGDRVPACVDADSDPATTVDFKAQIRPILDGKKPGTRGCFECHYRNTGNHAGIDIGHLALDTLGGLRQGGVTTGANIVIPGKPCTSGIVQRLRGTAEGVRMPKGGPYWGEQDMQLMIDWIAEGARGADGD